MVKRLLALPLWFFTTWWGYALAAGSLGLPPEGGPIVGALVAALVFLDPTGVVWEWEDHVPSSPGSSTAGPPDGIGAPASSR